MNKYLAIGGGVALLFAAPYACTALNVASKPAAVVNETFDVRNVIFNYERFFDMNARYEARSAQVQEFRNLYNTETDGSERAMLRIELAALQRSCRDIATKYNADSEKINREIFKSNGLPVRLSADKCDGGIF